MCMYVCIVQARTEPSHQSAVSLPGVEINSAHAGFSHETTVILAVFFSRAFSSALACEQH